MDDKTQQIETLIKLVEANNDNTWLEEFRSLRTGGYLPGGGAGSLNDWGPYYSEPIQSVWYSNLYNILRYLFDGGLGSNEIDGYKSIKLRNNIRIIRCLNCEKNYQHPSTFETHIALKFLRKFIPDLAAQGRLIEILNAGESYEKEDVVDYRNWLKSEYESNDIKIYDFVTAKYVCPHCGKTDSETEHDLYRVAHDRREFELVKQNAAFGDFEEV